MSARLHLAGPDDLERLMPLVRSFHDARELETRDEDRRAALAPLLEGSPHGAVWLIGPRAAPLGYVVITFGWSVEAGGLDGTIDELYIRAQVRGRGIATEALRSLMGTLAGSGLKALHLEVARDTPDTARLYRKLGFATRESHHLMTWSIPRN